MYDIIYKKYYLISKLLSFYLLTFSTFSHSQSNLPFDKIEINNYDKEMGNFSIIINDYSIIKNDKEGIYTLDIEYIEEFYKYINIFFITKEFPIYKTFHRVDGYRYSENETLNIILNYKCDKKDVFSVELAKSDFKIETTEEFNKFLRLIYGGYKIEWKKSECVSDPNL